MLKTQPVLLNDLQPATWLLTDDGASPEPTGQLPTDFKRNLVTLWAVRSDCLRLPRFVREPLPGTPPCEPDDALLKLLTAQPTVRQADEANL